MSDKDCLYLIIPCNIESLETSSREDHVNYHDDKIPQYCLHRSMFGSHRGTETLDKVKEAARCHTRYIGILQVKDYFSNTR